MSFSSAMDCEYAVEDEYRNTGSYITLCDCPGGCPYKKETTRTGKGIVGECTKIFSYDTRNVRSEQY